jgi:hypothetical protein
MNQGFLKPIKYGLSASFMSLSHSYSKSCTSLVKLSIQVLQENKVNLDELLKFILCRPELCWSHVGNDDELKTVSLLDGKTTHTIMVYPEI